jgi:hypothetical protein
MREEINNETAQIKRKEIRIVKIKFELKLALKVMTG